MFQRTLQYCFKCCCNENTADRDQFGSLSFYWNFHYNIIWTNHKILLYSIPLLLLLSRFSRVRLYATPETAAHQAPPSLGFSRQEHWSGLPFPSSMNESEKWKWSRSVVSDSSWPHGLQPTRLLRLWDFRQEYWSGCHCLLWYSILAMLYKMWSLLYWLAHHHRESSNGNDSFMDVESCNH